MSTGSTHSDVLRAWRETWIYWVLEKYDQNALAGVCQARVNCFTTKDREIAEAEANRMRAWRSDLKQTGSK